MWNRNSKSLIKVNKTSRILFRVQNSIPCTLSTRYGIVLKNLDLAKEAVENLECSIQMEPLFWGAWQELSTLCKDRQMVSICFFFNFSISAQLVNFRKTKKLL